MTRSNRPASPLPPQRKGKCCHLAVVRPLPLAKTGAERSRWSRRYMDRTASSALATLDLAPTGPPLAPGPGSNAVTPLEPGRAFFARLVSMRGQYGNFRIGFVSANFTSSLAEAAGCRSALKFATGPSALSQGVAFPPIQRRQLVQDAGLRLVGFKFGHQLLADALDALDV
jgi:hypothetical protein